jgi:NAD(P)-dependent dehydrogenase (short-subunit alcohol dehydrogenase family)
MSILDSFSLYGKVALVTGGAGQYGRQIVDAVAQAGARVYVASRNLQALEEMAEEHRAQGLEVSALQYDQGEELSILHLRDTIMAREGRIDVLVNNSVLRPMKGGYSDHASTFAESMQVNGTGLFMITRAVGDAMAEAGRGSIINIGSIYGLVGPDPSNYAGTTMHSWVPDYYFHKGGMVNFTRFIASYYGQHGVRCNCIHPGGFRTDTMPEAFVRQYSAHTCLGRLASGTDLMGIIVFLAADASAYITGANIPVDGGYTAK